MIVTIEVYWLGIILASQFILLIAIYLIYGYCERIIDKLEELPKMDEIKGFVEVLKYEFKEKKKVAQESPKTPTEDTPVRGLAIPSAGSAPYYASQTRRMSKMSGYSVNYEEIKKCLVAANITFRELTEIIDIPFSTFHSWCKDGFTPRLEPMKKAAALFEVPLEKIVFKKGKK